MSVPPATSYDAADMAGGVVSDFMTAIAWSDTASLGLPASSCTAPASTSSCGVAIEFTAAASSPLRPNVIESPVCDDTIPLESVTPPEFWPESRT